MCGIVQMELKLYSLQVLFGHLDCKPVDDWVSDYR